MVEAMKKPFCLHSYDVIPYFQVEDMELGLTYRAPTRWCVRCGKIQVRRWWLIFPWWEEVVAYDDQKESDSE